MKTSLKNKVNHKLTTTSHSRRGMGRISSLFAFMILYATVSSFGQANIRLKGKDTITTEKCRAYTDPGYTVKSGYTVTVSATPAFSNSVPGTYVFKYFISGSSNPADTIKYRIVIVTKDTTPPDLIVTGPVTTLMAVTSSAVTVTPPSVISANDLCDGPLASSVLIDASAVQTNVLGTYPVTYTVSDLSGNKATVYRYFKIIDTIPPKVTLNGPQVDSVAVFEPYTDPGVTYSDNYDKISDLTVTRTGTYYSAFGTKNPNITGNAYTIIYRVTDKSGNKDSVMRVVKVQDRVAPVITLLGPSVVTICQYATFIDSGYKVVDNYNTVYQLIIDTVGTFYLDSGTRKPGFYTLGYIAVDKSGNRKFSGYRYIYVVPANDLACRNSLKNIIDTTVCKNSCPYFTFPASGYSYIWSTGDTGRTIRFCPKGDTAIWVKLVHSTDTTTYLYSITVTKSSCVWPGDANGDGVADKNDILAIGIAYADTGAKRAAASLTWSGQPCADWANSFTSGANHKNADCNGDGAVDSTDMAAVAKNYGLKHSKAPAMNGSPSDPPFSVSFSKDSSNAGDTLSATLSLGSAANQVTNAYGLAFSIKYPSMYIKANGLKADFSNCWLGTQGKNLISFVYNDSANNSLEVALSRTDHKNVSGYGSLGTVRIVMQDNVGGKNSNHAKVYLNLADVNLISYNESPILLYATNDSMKFSYLHLAGINNQSPYNSRIQLYPNPATQNLTVDAGADILSQIVIINIMGKEVYNARISGSGKMEIPVAQLPSGIYSIRTLTKNGTSTRVFVKQ